MSRSVLRSHFSIELMIFIHNGLQTSLAREFGSFLDGILNLFLVGFLGSGFFCTWLIRLHAWFYMFYIFMPESLFNTENAEHPPCSWFEWLTVILVCKPTTYGLVYDKWWEVFMTNTKFIRVGIISAWVLNHKVYLILSFSGVMTGH